MLNTAMHNYHAPLLWNAFFFLLLVCRKLRTSDAGQMVLNMSVALICHYTAFTIRFFENRQYIAMCFLLRMLADYFGFVYQFLNAAEAMNMFVQMVLVFKKIDHFPLKASLVAWSKLP